MPLCNIPIPRNPVMFAFQCVNNEPQMLVERLLELTADVSHHHHHIIIIITSSSSHHHHHHHYHKYLWRGFWSWLQMWVIHHRHRHKKSLLHDLLILVALLPSSQIQPISPRSLKISDTMVIFSRPLVQLELRPQVLRLLLPFTEELLPQVNFYAMSEISSSPPPS